MNAVDFVHQQLTTTPKLPKFKAGDNITVNYKIVEGSKERIQSFKGDVIKRQGTGATATFTVRKVSDGVGVERLFPFSLQTLKACCSIRWVRFAGLNCSTCVKGVVKVLVSRKKEWLSPSKNKASHQYILAKSYWFRLFCCP